LHTLGQSSSDFLCIISSIGKQC